MIKHNLVGNFFIYLLQFLFLNKATPVLVKNSKDFVNLVFGLGVETHFDKKGFIIKWISSWNKQTETGRDAEKQSKIWTKKN